MSIFLYLNKVEHVKTWVDGGMVPLGLVSDYKGDVRSGTTTPDEMYHYEADRALYNVLELNDPRNSMLRGLMSGLSHDAIKRGLYLTGTFEGNVIVENGRIHRVPDISVKENRIEDGLVLCLSNVCSSEIASRLVNDNAPNGKEACVEITNLRTLKSTLDKQIGIFGKQGKCEYTSTHNRNAFLKHVDDEWQAEYRLYWANAERCEVKIPENIAKLARVFV